MPAAREQQKGVVLVQPMWILLQLEFQMALNYSFSCCDEEVRVQMETTKNSVIVLPTKEPDIGEMDEFGF